MNEYIYDIETLRNMFSIALLNIQTKKVDIFYILYNTEENVDINQYCEMLNFLDKTTCLIGYNNLGFDYPVIHELLERRSYFKQMKTKDLVDFIYKKAQEVIDSEYPNISRPLIKQIDLYKIMHYDNDSKRTSLKHIQYATNFSNIQEMPYSHKDYLTYNQMMEIADYNINDINATFTLYEIVRGNTTHSVYKGEDRIAMREQFGKKYDLDLTNHNDPKIGSDILLKLYSERNNLNKKVVSSFRYTPKPISLKECILEKISFNFEGFQNLIDWLKEQTITETKGTFKDIEVKTIPKLLPFIACKVMKGKVKDLSIKYNGGEFIYGTGGIHQCAPPGIYSSNDEWIILDADVTSLYPNLCVTNRWYPEHLGESFYIVYKNDIIDVRVAAKKAGDKVVDKGLKLGANGAYGKFNDINSWMCSPITAMKITLNGQLFLTKLVEMLCENLSDLTVIQTNTDGITVKVKRSEIEKYYEICKEWESFSNLNLEYVTYSKMVIRDVNNYIAFYDDSKKKPKLKGEFEIDKELHKDPSQKIVYKALLEYYQNNIPVEKTIKECKDIYDFCKMCRAKSGGWFELHYFKDDDINRDKLQKLNRYYVSNTQFHLKKLLPPLNQITKTEKHKQDVDANQMNIFDLIEDNTFKEKNRIQDIESGYTVQIFNKFEEKEFNDYNINYDYYIDQCNKFLKVIKPIE